MSVTQATLSHGEPPMTLAIDLTRRVVLILGAGGGIGRPTALLAARAGAKVICAEGPHGEEAGEETVRLINAAGGEAMFILCDVLDDQSCADAVEAAEETFGPIAGLKN